MALINTAADIKKHNSSATVTFSLDSIQSFVDDAINKDILPAIGRATLTQLTTGTPAADSDHEFALNLVQKAAVNFALAYYISFGSVQLSDAGAHVQTDTTLRPASDKKIMAMRKQSFADAHTALEMGIMVLESNHTFFSDYATSEEHKQNRNCFINTSKEFTLSCSDIITAQVFASLKGEVGRVERDCIENILGEDLTNTLRGKILAGNPTDNEKKLIQRIQRAVAPLALAGIIPYRSISMDADGIFQTSEGVGGMAANVETRGPADDRKLQTAMFKYTTRGEAELEALRKWLNIHKADFTGYTESDLSSLSKVGGSEGIYFM